MVSVAPLTRRQAAILAEIRLSVRQRGYPPSVREIGAAVGLKSSSSVAHQLRNLMAAGYITHDPNGPRTIVLTDKAPVEAEVCEWCGKRLHRATPPPGPETF